MTAIDRRIATSHHPSRPMGLFHPSRNGITHIVSKSRCAYHQSHARRRASQYRSRIDESSISQAQHKPRLSDPSIGYLITELSTTTPQMLGDGLRVEGQTIDEADRKMIRRLAYGTVGIGAIFAAICIGAGTRRGDEDQERE